MITINASYNKTVKKIITTYKFEVVEINFDKNQARYLFENSKSYFTRDYREHDISYLIWGEYSYTEKYNQTVENWLNDLLEDNIPNYEHWDNSLYIGWQKKNSKKWLMEYGGHCEARMLSIEYLPKLFQMLREFYNETLIGDYHRSRIVSDYINQIALKIDKAKKYKYKCWELTTLDELELETIDFFQKSITKKLRGV